MNARFVLVTVALSLAANACGTIVSPDVAPIDAALSDVARPDAPAPPPDVQRSIRTALRPDSEVALYRARTMSGEDRTTLHFSAGRRDELVGPRWEEITEGHCTISTHRYPDAPGTDVEHIDPFLWSFAGTASRSVRAIGVVATSADSRRQLVSISR